MVLPQGLVARPAQSLSATVISVGDGDAVTVALGGKTVKVRLGCIDSPELQQKPFGESSRQRLKALLPAGTPVTLRVITTDRYGRTVAEVFKGAKSINLIMVQEGQSVIYREYFQGCQDSKAEYEQAELGAKQRKLAFWRQQNPVMPWDFRRGVTATTRLTPSANGCDPAYPDFCLAPRIPDLDCKDVSARRFRVLPPDPHRFDGDGDGIGCEK
ncbi:MAG: thermonuclease family protein [Synechocystis sp.]|nr:thermonuclease family protein [Synechocystis sp.]